MCDGPSIHRAYEAVCRIKRIDQVDADRARRMVAVRAATLKNRSHVAHIANLRGAAARLPALIGAANACRAAAGDISGIRLTVTVCRTADQQHGQPTDRTRGHRSAHGVAV